jgi:integrase
MPRGSVGSPECVVERSGYSQPLKPGRITSRFSTLRKEANLKQIRLHDLRHFAVTMMLAGGVDVRQTAPHTDKGLTL